MSTHHGWIKEFSGWVRVDCFTRAENPYLVEDDLGFVKREPTYLLTHAHTDHLNGLDSPDFRGKIICTPSTKAILLKSMEAGNRFLITEAPPSQVNQELINSKLMFPNFNKVISGPKKLADLIITIEMNVPKLITGPEGDIKITALDANHCPGSCMFLIEGKIDGFNRAVLVTGDIRMEPEAIRNLALNPIVSPYLRTKQEDSITDNNGIWKRLDCIYLDTTLVLCDVDVVSKQEAVNQVIKLMLQYPPSTKFFINGWTYGYELFYEAVSRTFNEAIHFDWFKHSLYSDPALRTAYPSLANLGTLDDPTRFHACERRWKCDAVFGTGLGCYIIPPSEQAMLHSGKKKTLVRGRGGEEVDDIVRITPDRMSRERTDSYFAYMQERVERAVARQESEKKKRAGEIVVAGLSFVPSGTGSELRPSDDSTWPGNIFLPIDRHSSLPELRALVGLFRPSSLYPLTMSVNLHGFFPEYSHLGTLFEDVLPPGDRATIDRAAATLIQYESTLPLSKKWERLQERNGVVIAEQGMDVYSGGALSLVHDEFGENLDDVEDVEADLSREDFAWDLIYRIERDTRRARLKQRVLPINQGEMSHRSQVDFAITSTSFSGGRRPSYMDSVTGKKIVDYGSGGSAKVATSPSPAIIPPSTPCPVHSRATDLPPAPRDPRHMSKNPLPNLGQPIAYPASHQGAKARRHAAILRARADEEAEKARRKMAKLN